MFFYVNGDQNHPARLMILVILCFSLHEATTSKVPLMSFCFLLSPCAETVDGNGVARKHRSIYRDTNKGKQH